MYKALIIDDENEAIESVYNAFNWHNLNVTDVVKINETQDLTKRILAEKPHIVFIDIEMGDVFGLHIIEECSKLLPLTLFVIISGHDSFEYARLSIQLDVVYYLLKPFTEYEVDIATEKLMNHLNIRFGSSTGVLLDDINSFLSNKTQFQNFLLEDGISFPNSYRFIVMCMEKVNVESLKLCLQERLIKRYKIGQKKYLFVVEEPLNESNMILLGNMILFNKITMGISEPFQNPEDMFGCFKQANMLAYGGFIDDTRKIFEIEEAGVEDFNACVDAVQSYFDAGEFNMLQKVLNKFPEKARKKRFNMEEMVFFYNSFVVQLNAVLRKNKKKDYLYNLSFEELINEYSNIENMCESLLQALEIVTGGDQSSLNEMDKATSNNTVEQVKNHLKQNYSQKIRIKDLSNMFFISEAYLSEIFKNLTHKTIVEYLTDIRLEVAKELLSDSQMNISNIAESVGYGDYCYFNKIFKKYMGVTPYQYRKNRKGNVERED